LVGGEWGVGVGGGWGVGGGGWGERHTLHCIPLWLAVLTCVGRWVGGSCVWVREFTAHPQLGLLPPQCVTLSAGVFVLCFCWACALVGQPSHRNALYSYGEITTIKVVPRNKCAFIEYATHGQAKLAAESKFHSLEIKVCVCVCVWTGLSVGAPPPTHAPHCTVRHPPPLMAVYRFRGTATPHPSFCPRGLPVATLPLSLSLSLSLSSR
jgi:hypothetical protein